MNESLIFSPGASVGDKVNLTSLYTSRPDSHRTLKNSFTLNDLPQPL